MAYATQAQFQGEFGASELAQLIASRPTGFADSAASADGEINEYLAGRYALPLSFVPAGIVSIALDIVRFRLYDESPLEIVVERYKRAVQRLRDISDGRAVLTDAMGKVLPGPVTGNGGPAGAYAPERAIVYGAGFDARFAQLDPTAASAP